MLMFLRAAVEFGPSTRSCLHNPASFWSPLSENLCSGYDVTCEQRPLGAILRALESEDSPSASRSAAGVGRLSGVVSLISFALLSWERFQALTFKRLFAPDAQRAQGSSQEGVISVGRNFCVKGVILNPHTSRKGASPRTSGTCVTFFSLARFFVCSFLQDTGAAVCPTLRAP